MHSALLSVLFLKLIVPKILPHSKSPISFKNTLFPSKTIPPPYMYNTPVPYIIPASLHNTPPPLITPASLQNTPPSYKTIRLLTKHPDSLQNIPPPYKTPRLLTKNPASHQNTVLPPNSLSLSKHPSSSYNFPSFHFPLSIM